MKHTSKLRHSAISDALRTCTFLLLPAVGFCEATHAETAVKVATLPELREAVRKSDQSIVMKPGRYELADLPGRSRSISCSGSNNTIDLSGVHVNAPVGSTRRGYVSISGDHNVFRGGTFEDTYRSGLKEVTDFSAYNRDRSDLAKGLGGGAVFSVTGDNNTVVGTKLTVRGSFPYGYGSIYGIGADHVFGLDKRCGILIKGRNNTLDGCEVQQRAFGHGIYMQSPADRTVVKNCLVEGRMRPSEELYSERNPRDLPARSKYKLPRSRNKPIPKDVMIPLSEDGIRVYAKGGSVTVENCTVKKMRGGIRLYLASRATVKNSTAIDCGNTNFNLPWKGRISGSSGNFAYAPLSDFRLSKSAQQIEWTILPSPHAEGPHNIADVQGDDHDIVFLRAGGPVDKTLRPIVISGDDSTIRNETEYPITLLESASGNKVTSLGKVTDHGRNNKVTRIEPATTHSGTSGRQLPETRDEGFVHPGMLHNQAELDFVREKVRAKEKPWIDSWNQLLKAEISSLDYEPKAIAKVYRGPYEKPDIGAGDLERASGAAYSQATQWVVTGDPVHAHKAIEIFNDYAHSLKFIGDNDAKLPVGMSGTMMLNAAEIIRHTSSFWKKPDQQQFEIMIRDVYYGTIMAKVWPAHTEWFPRANGNWDASMMQTMLCIAIFFDDAALFEHAVEYTAKYNLGNELPFEEFITYDGRPTNGERISSRGRGRFYPMWEKGYHHYHGRMGMEMPSTKQVLERIRPQQWYIKFPIGQSLMFRGLPAFPKGYVQKVETNWEE